MNTIELNEQQREFLTYMLNEAIKNDTAYSNTSLTIINQILSQLETKYPDEFISEEEMQTHE